VKRDPLEKAFNRLGDFGKLFVDYKGCPRGQMGRACVPIEEEVLLMPPVIDVDYGKWIPVNAEALYQLVEEYEQLKKDTSENTSDQLSTEDTFGQRTKEREELIDGIGRILKSLSNEQLRRVLWYINRIWK